MLKIESKMVYMEIYFKNCFGKIAALEKLKLPFLKEEVGLYMEDGSKILEDEDLSDSDMVGGKLLIVATSFQTYLKGHKHGIWKIWLFCVFLLLWSVI